MLKCNKLSLVITLNQDVIPVVTHRYSNLSISLNTLVGPTQNLSISSNTFVFKIKKHR